MGDQRNGFHQCYLCCKLNTINISDVSLTFATAHAHVLQQYLMVGIMHIDSVGQCHDECH